MRSGSRESNPDLCHGEAAHCRCATTASWFHYVVDAGLEPAFPRRERGGLPIAESTAASLTATRFHIRHPLWSSQRATPPAGPGLRAVFTGHRCWTKENRPLPSPEAGGASRLSWRLISTIRLVRGRVPSHNAHHIGRRRAWRSPRTASAGASRTRSCSCLSPVRILAVSFLVWAYGMGRRIGEATSFSARGVSAVHGRFRALSRKWLAEPDGIEVLDARLQNSRTTCPTVRAPSPPIAGTTTRSWRRDEATGRHTVDTESKTGHSPKDGGDQGEH